MRNFTIKYVAIVAIVLFVLGGAIMLLWPEDNEPAKKPLGKPTTSQNQSRKAEESDDKAATNQTSATTPNSQSNSGATAKATDTKNTTSTSQLSNTGPGETFALFAASSLLFAMLYNLHLRRQVS